MQVSFGQPCKIVNSECINVMAFLSRLIAKTGDVMADVVHGDNRVFSRPVALLMVTMERLGQTNQPSVTTGSPLISPLDHADKASAGSPIG